MDWRVLGPLEVWADGSPVNLGGRQRRLVLAILLANADQTVSTDRLIDEVWDGSPPDSARKTVQAHVAHLRKVLNGVSEVLTPSGDGYLLTPAQGSVDAGRFESAVDEARRVREDPARAVELLDEALAWFRGEPYAGLTDDALTVKVEATRLSELRLSAREDRLEALLASRKENRVAADVEKLLAEHPLRERLWAIQMLALYRGGRQSEALRSYSRARHILSEELGIEPSHELQTLEQQILDQDDSLAASTLAPAAPSPAVDVRRNPYKGLRAFDEADADDFFGRAELVELLVDRLSRRPPASLTFLAGPSGAGKSSVLRAGLIPRLRDLGLGVVVMFPGDNPEAALDEARRDAGAQWEKDDPQRSVDVVAVDQFEELFTYAAGEHVDGFISRMAQGTDSTRWLVTVRADFLDQLLAHPQLGRRLQESLVLVPPLEDDDVAAAIVEPARRVGVEAEPSLVATVVRDVQARPSSLPLLQYAMTDLFDRRRGDILTLEAYERAGGLSGALVRRADQVYARLTEEERAIARQIFLQLTSIAENGEFARRRVQRNSLYAHDRQLVDEILEQFGTQRLLTFDQDPETGHATVEVAHESLLEVWPRLAGWIDEAREDILMRSAMNTALSEWEANDCDASFLLSGGRLALHETWSADTDLALTEKETAFLVESRRNVDLARRRRHRRRNWILTGFGVAAAIAMVFGLVALNSAEQADRERKLAEARGLLANARAVMGEDSELALLLALEGTSALGDDPQAFRTLREAVHNMRTVSVFQYSDPDALTFAEISADGSQILLGGESKVELRETESADVIWEYETGPFVLSLPQFHDEGAEVVVNAWRITPLGSKIQMESPESAGIHVLDSATGELLRRFDTGPCGGFGAGMGSSSLLVAVITPTWFERNGCAIDEANRLEAQPYVIDLMTGEMEPVGRPFREAREQYMGLIDAAGERVVHWDAANSTVVSEMVGSGAEEVLIEDAPGAAAAGALSQNGRIAIFGGEADLDGRPLHVYDLEERTELSVLAGHSGRTTSIQFLSDGRRVLTAGEDGLVKTWDLFTGELLGAVDTGDGPAFYITVTEAEDVVAVERIGAVSLVSLAPRPEVGELDGCPPGDHPFFHGASLEVRGSTLMVREGCSSEVEGFDGGRGFVFDLETGALVEQGPMSASQGIALSQDGRLIASQRFTPGTPRARDGFHGNVVVKSIVTGEELEMKGLCEWRPGVIGDECAEPPAPPFTGFIWDLDFSPDGLMLLGGNDAGPGIVWDTDSGEILQVWPFYEAEFTPDGSHIVSISPITGEVELRDAADFSVIARTNDFDNWHLAITPDGNRVVASEAGGNLLFLDTETLEETDHWVGIHESPIRHLDFSTDGTMIATISYDGFAKVWDLESGDLLHEIPFVTDGTRGQSIAFADDGQHLWVSAEYGPLSGFTLDNQELLDIARDRVVRGFTEAECLDYFADTECPTVDQIEGG